MTPSGSSILVPASKLLSTLAGMVQTHSIASISMVTRMKLVGLRSEPAAESSQQGPSLIPHGQNVLVGVGDSGIDVKSTFYYDPNHNVKYAKSGLDSNHRKIALYYPFIDSTEATTGGHGTHVCGTLAGKAHDDDVSDYNGLASEARIVFFDMENTQEEFYSPADLYSRYFDVFYSLGVRIVSNSWGSIETYDYDEECTDVDKFVWENNDMTIVFAAGNDGELGFNTVGTPGLAKNSICVGSSNGHYVVQDKFDYISYFSSRGNRYSNRIMPHVVSIGDMRSAKSLSRYDCHNDCDDHSDTISVDIRASLIKAMIIHSTVPTKGYCLKSKTCQEYTSDRKYFEGWGRVQLDQVLRFDDSDFELFLYYGQINKKKENVVFRIPLYDTKAFKATMVYTDPPVSETSSNLLGNDIDMTIKIEGSSSVLYPNGGASEDRYNNIEQITIPEGELSEGRVVIVTISRYNLIKKLQPFSVVFTGSFDVDKIEITDDTSKNEKDEPQSQRSNGINIAVVIVILAIIIILVIVVVKICRKKTRENMMRAGRGNQSNATSSMPNHGTVNPPMGYGMPNQGVMGAVNPPMGYGVPVQAIPVASPYLPPQNK
ncbi:Peptidase S8/S53 domain-containing protein [Blastocystis sp. subtype 4]|uniref:Peptidase S8/S53 domain-containing protein n=1 Tax=Blastocystis sp. subtype 4 TaxID=944170 RepID=UPI0007121E1A|nr:Peptidase S8/S53 domain-containing protein [Blastocystis sp. subtype 4]KNB46743.1 Peptidase S8/S53 domain-containing protein [Blastocystis sp. subtype 4]|eukprot:XP_014530186.1 Peptidase S8/S53 domain-containing protein [Blastocystis sp. subtype 4]